MTDVNLSKLSNHPLWVGDSIINKISQILPLGKYSSIAILTERNVAPHWLSALKKAIDREVVELIIPPGEKSKTIVQCERVWTKMLKANLDRRSLLINLGGGMIGDLGGFVASTYMRGIDFVQLPTSLLSMVDASCGGKTGVNLEGVKNIIGSFKEPAGVIVDVSFLDTLPKRELISGFAEIIKHAIISDRNGFEDLKKTKIDSMDHGDLIRIITDSIRIKLSIVKQDPKEKGMRKILNFGHTIGHAIETLSHKTKRPLLHGEAVAIGMVAESRLSNMLGLLSKKDADAIEEVIGKSGLPTYIKGIELKDIMKLILLDKKNQKKKVNWSLPKKIGSAGFDIKADDGLVVEAIKSILL